MRERQCMALQHLSGCQSEVKRSHARECGGLGGRWLGSDHWERNCPSLVTAVVAAHNSVKNFIRSRLDGGPCGKLDFAIGACTWVGGMGAACGMHARARV